MKDRYDVIVVGAGPGGSWAAKHAAEQGVSVLLLEKDSEVGTPVRCAEGVSESDLRRFVDVKDYWIAQVVKGARLIAPDGTVVESYPDEVGVILHRKVFDFDLALMAAQAGAEVVTKAYVNGLLFEHGTVAGVKLNYMGEELQIRSSVVIGADGVESRVGRWAGLKTWVFPKEMASCAQMTLTNIEIDPDIVEFYSLYKQSMNRNKAISKYALEYFINIFETFGRTGELTYLMAYLRDQAIAGIVVLTSDGWAHYLHGGMDYTFRKHKASDLLFYTAILNALSGGVAYFDYGATSPDDVQLLRYKTKLGSKVAAVPVLEKSINPVRCKVMDGVARVLNFPLFLTLYNKYRSRRM